MTTKLLVIYCSMYGRQGAAASALVEAMAHEVAAGARATNGVEAVVMRVPDLVSEDASPKNRTASVPVASAEELQEFDAIIFGIPAWHSNMAVQMQDFLRQISALGKHGELVGKVVSIFTSTRGVGMSAIFPIFPVLFGRGMITVGWHSPDPGWSVIGGGMETPSATVVTASAQDVSPSHSAPLLAEARSHGRYVAKIAKQLWP
ncbi:MAG: NAD(P)H-dependent oxidoreductase [Elusimicrobiota bacterium]